MTTTDTTEARRAQKQATRMVRLPPVPRYHRRRFYVCIECEAPFYHDALPFVLGAERPGHGHGGRVFTAWADSVKRVSGKVFHALASKRSR